MPAEWHKHKATWISWPHNKDTWKNIKEIEGTYAQIVKGLHTGEIVNILVNDLNEEKSASKKLLAAKVSLSQVKFWKIPTVDAWIRDYGPNFLINEKTKEAAFNKWVFNAWGNKYEDLKQDTNVPDKINQTLKLRCFNPGIVLEGGSIDVNGKGICMTTEQCLLNKNRNPHLSKAEIEDYLKNYLGVNEILWLKKGIEGDDTDGHIDDIARFVNENTILLAYAEKGDKNHYALHENLMILEDFAKNRKFNIVKLPIPTVMDGDFKLPASYANFLIGNDAGLVPIYGDKGTDKEALEIIGEYFPTRKTIGINCRALVYGFGAIHCMSQQEPLA